MCVACSTHGDILHNILVAKPKVSDRSEELAVDGRTVLQFSFPSKVT